VAPTFPSKVHGQHNHLFKGTSRLHLVLKLKKKKKEKTIEKSQTNYRNGKVKILP
jgi:hypothetical protein